MLLLYSYFAIIKTIHFYFQRQIPDVEIEIEATLTKVKHESKKGIREGVEA